MGNQLARRNGDITHDLRVNFFAQWQMFSTDDMLGWSSHILSLTRRWGTLNHDFLRAVRLEPFTVSRCPNSPTSERKTGATVSSL